MKLGGGRSIGGIGGGLIGIIPGGGGGMRNPEINKICQALNAYLYKNVILCMCVLGGNLS